MEAGASNMEMDIKDFIEHFSEKLTKEYSKQQDFVFELEDLLANSDLQKSFRISQIDLIDILSSPDPKSNEIEELIKENHLEVKDSLPRINAQYRNVLENYLTPYGIDIRDWNNYHGQGYDALDLPKIPKRSISIGFDQGKSGAWAPNGYGKTFAFEKILRLLDVPSESDPFDAFEDFLRQCTALLQPNPDGESTFDEAQLQKNGKRLIPFRMLCFSVQAFNGNFATDIFSISIEIKYNSSGHYLLSSFGLHLPETRENFVIEENVILPNWVISDQAVVKWDERKKYSSEEPDWREIGLRLLLNMKIDYLELPRVAFSSKAEKIVQENIAKAVDACIDSAVSQDYDDLEIDKLGLLTSLNKLNQNRFLIESLETIVDETFDEENNGPGKNALLNLVSKLTDIQNELQNLVGAKGESWRLQCKLLTPSYERSNSLDITNAIHPTAILLWNHLSFGQRNELLFKSTLLRTKYTDGSVEGQQRVLVIDEPEAGRSEEWVSHLIDDINRFEPKSSVLILSHRGIVLESANLEGKYKILHTALPEEEDLEEDELLEWNSYKNSAGDASIVDNKMALIRAFAPSPVAETWAACFPESTTPSAESGWIRFGGPNHLWYLKPTHLDLDTANQMSEFISNTGLTNDSFLKIFWNGFQWVPSDTQSRYRILKSLDKLKRMTKTNNDYEQLYLLDYPSKYPLVKGQATTKFPTLPGITSGGIRLPKKPEHLVELINFANKYEILALNPHLLGKERQRLKAEFKISHTLSNKFLNFLKQITDDEVIPNNLDIKGFLTLLERNTSSPSESLKKTVTQSKGNFKDLETYYRLIQQFYEENPKAPIPTVPRTSQPKNFFEYLRDDLEVDLQFEIEDLIPVVESVATDSENIEKKHSNKEKVEDYKWREDVLLRVMTAHSIDESQRNAFLNSAVNFNPNVKRYLKKADLESAAEQFSANAMVSVEEPVSALTKTTENVPKVPTGGREVPWSGDSIEERVLNFNMHIITEFGTKYPEYRALQQTPYPARHMNPLSRFKNMAMNYSASLDAGIAQAITSLDSLKSHPHSGEFHFEGYAWCLKTLGIIRNTECSISDYACELILGYAEHLQNKVLVDNLIITGAKEYNPEVGEDDIILLDHYIRTAAQEISKLDGHIDYDRFEDPCGPVALIRVDAVLDDGVDFELGYRCMNCQMTYDEGYRKNK
tara:strand:+ start:1575 stop:5132 length:3558 start_codon:yes stop_codon:yes gene_type:complete